MTCPRYSDTVSVVIPCYNAGPWLKQTLDSVVTQTCLPHEVILVDDGSTDDSATIASSFSPLVRVIFQENQGESVARNRGIEEAKGDWIAFLDADDVWQPTKLEQQLRLATNRDGIACVHTGYFRFGDVEEQPPTPDWAERRNFTPSELILRPLVLPSSAMVRRSTQLRFPEWTRAGEDMLYFADLARHGDFIYLPEHLVGYRSHSTQQHLSSKHWIAHTQSRLRWLDDQRDIDAPSKDSLRQAIQEKPLKQLRDFRRQREWTQYWQLRTFLSQLVWPLGKPKALDQRVLPKLAYQVKDSLVATTKRWCHQGGGS